MAVELIVILVGKHKGMHLRAFERRIVWCGISGVDGDFASHVRDVHACDRALREAQRVVINGDFPNCYAFAVIEAKDQFVQITRDNSRVAFALKRQPVSTRDANRLFRSRCRFVAAGR